MNKGIVVYDNVAMALGYVKCFFRPSERKTQRRDAIPCTMDKKEVSVRHIRTDLSFRPRQIDDRNANTTPLLKPNYCINLRSLHPRQNSTLALSRATETPSV